jgi:hypothetical protein
MTKYIKVGRLTQVNPTTKVKVKYVTGDIDNTYYRIEATTSTTLTNFANGIKDAQIVTADNIVMALKSKPLTPEQQMRQDIDTIFEALVSLREGGVTNA